MLAKVLSLGPAVHLETILVSDLNNNNVYYGKVCIYCQNYYFHCLGPLSFQNSGSDLEQP